MPPKKPVAAKPIQKSTGKPVAAKNLAVRGSQATPVKKGTRAPAVQAATSTSETVGEKELPGQKVMLKQLANVLFNDVDNKIRDSGKWPLLIDPDAQAATFLRYRDTNYIDAVSTDQMDPDKIRLAILGSLRYGKPAVLDMMEVDIFETCSDKFDVIFPGLMNSIMDKSIMEEENYSKLIKETDVPDYQLDHFDESRISDFMFIVISKNPSPPVGLLDKTYVIRIENPV